MSERQPAEATTSPAYIQMPLPQFPQPIWAARDTSGRELICARSVLAALRVSWYRMSPAIEMYPPFRAERSVNPNKENTVLVVAAQFTALMKLVKRFNSTPATLKRTDQLEHAWRLRRFHASSSSADRAALKEDRKRMVNPESVRALHRAMTDGADLMAAAKVAGFGVVTARQVVEGRYSMTGRTRQVWLETFGQETFKSVRRVKAAENH